MSATLITDSSRKNAHGFTLIEIIAVLVIIGIMSAVAVTIFSSLDKYKLISEVEILKSHLRYAQSRAMNDTVSWGISFNTENYWLKRYGESTTLSDLPNEGDASHSLDQFGVTASFTSNKVIFDIWGTPVDIDNDNNPISVPIWITLKAGSDEKKIKVTPNTGFIP